MYTATHCNVTFLAALLCVNLLIIFSVIGAPFIRVPPVSVTGQLGGGVRLDCLSEGDPLPKIYWHSNRAGEFTKRWIGSPFPLLNPGLSCTLATRCCGTFLPLLAGLSFLN